MRILYHPPKNRRNPTPVLAQIVSFTQQIGEQHSVLPVLTHAMEDPSGLSARINRLRGRSEGEHGKN